MIPRLSACLLLLFSAGLSRVCASVFSPTDVRVSCHNFENIVSWNYSNPELQPEFNVTILRYSKPKIVLKTTENFLDISNYTQDVEEVYLVSVRTLNVPENETSAEIAFTYKQDFPLDKKCTVDFPSVNISALKHTFTIFFEHPMDIYEIDFKSDEFKYTVKCNETDCGKYSCIDLCTAEIPIPESLYGSCFSLQFNGEIGSTRFEGSKEVCSPNEAEAVTETDVSLITGLVCAAIVLLMLGIVAGVTVYKKLTKPANQIKFRKILGMVSTEAQVNVPEHPAVSPVTSVSHTPLLITPDDDDNISTPTTHAPEEVTHLRLNIDTVLDVPDEDEQRGSEEEEEEDFCNGGYDRKKFPLEMSPGDVVEAYRP